MQLLCLRCPIAPLNERGVLRRFQDLLASAELPKMRIHDLWHSAVAILLAQGVTIKVISKLLGHSSVAFTLQFYGYLLEEAKRDCGQDGYSTRRGC